MLFLCFTLFIITLVLFWIQKQKRKKHPPGPLGLPFFGMKPYLVLRSVFPNLFPKINYNQQYLDMKKKYGDIWSLDMGDKRINVLASYGVITEAMVDNGLLFCSRPLNGIRQLISEYHGFMFANGERWHSNRHLATKALKELGMGSNRLEDLITEEVHALIEYIEQKGSNSITSPIIFAKPISNVVSQVVFDKRYDYDNKEMEEFLNNMDDILHSSEAHDILEIFSSFLPLKCIRILFPVVGRFVNSVAKCTSFIEANCKSRINIEREYIKSNCVFDYFWRYRYQDQPCMSFEDKLFDIHHSMFDLYMAGIDTSEKTLGFLFLILAQYRDIQKELRDEVKTLVSDYKLVNLEMKKHCPKMLSFIDEVFRFCAVVPPNNRQVISDIVFRNYEIRASDVVLIDAGTHFRDPEFFPDPFVFKPYRFLNNSGTSYVPSKFLIPFGMGKRMCMGESIAQMELFLFLSKIILKFDVSISIETSEKFEKIMEGTVGLIHAPLDHFLIFTDNYLEDSF